MVIRYFNTFRAYAGNRLLLLVLTIFLGGLFEGIGIGLFLPLLNFQSLGASDDKFSRFIYESLELMGLPVTIPVLLIFLVIVFMAKGVMTYLQVVASSWITADLSMRLRSDIASQYTTMDYGYYVRRSTGYFNNLVTLEVDRAVSGLSKFCELISYFIYVCIYFAAAFFINLKASVVVLLISIALFFSFKILYRLSAKYSIDTSNTNAQMQSMMIQLIHFFKYLKSTNSFKPIIGKLNEDIVRLSSLNFRLGALGGVLRSFVEPFIVMLVCLMIYYHVIIKGLPLAEIIILLVFFHRTFSKVFSIQMTWQKFHASLGGIYTIQKAVSDLKVNSESVRDGKLAFSTGDIVYRNVGYAYGTKKVLNDISLEIPQNATIGIVGESGAGKTTFFDLITGLLTPQEGVITINGIPYDEVRIGDLRSVIGYVTQEPVLFNDTVANNISFWRCDNRDQPCDSRIQRAARLAYCSDFIEKLEDGYETIVGDRGVKLSGGQKQRIAIARELFKEPDILIFDEATSALDTESEQYIQKSIAELKGAMTMIIIAHRLSTIKDCEKIYVLSDGRIIESGCYDDLYALPGGLFRTMCEAQRL